MAGYFGGLTDAEALRRIHNLMSGTEWDSDTTAAIADILAMTDVGRPADLYDAEDGEAPCEVCGYYQHAVDCSVLQAINAELDQDGE